MENTKKAINLHHNLPVDYYQKAIKNNPLQAFWHKRRFKEISKIVKEVNGEVLDIGCADGTFTKIILEKTKAEKIIGVDILSGVVKYASKRFGKNKKMKFQVADAHTLPFEDKKFQAVFCLEVMEHIFDPKKVLSEIKRVLALDGYIVVLVPTDSFLFKVCWWVVLKTWGKHWKETHIHSFSKKKPLSETIRNQGFIIEEDKKFLLGMLNVVRARKKT
ncbi:class I SAM-dependent methyltransferase [Patescibacteria group bacterium]|nr:class I SAM-dependent methyltransferase [Patescibacteria group bacterium]